jgi:hypothetical protein
MYKNSLEAGQSFLYNLINSSPVLEESRGNSGLRRSPGSPITRRGKIAGMSQMGSHGDERFLKDLHVEGGAELGSGATI